MADMYVYLFKGLPGSAHENTLSKRHATLDAIRAIGEAIMESQIVVDHTELDADGFVRLRSGQDPYAANDVTVQIFSLELRALSRDSEAAQLDDRASGKDKYMLSLESRELRKQAHALQTQGTTAQARARAVTSDARAALRAKEFNPPDEGGFSLFSGSS